MDSEVWTPPETREELLKRLLVPPGVYARYLYRKAIRSGEREIGLIPLLADRGRVAIDVGANKGAYTYALLNHGCKVHAFEPNPKMFRVLDSWARRRAELYPLAVGAAPGCARLMIPRTSGGYSNQGGTLSAVMIGDRAFGSVDVDVVALDQLGLNDVGFIKIDVEGFELEVLRGCASILSQDRPNLLIEMEERHTKQPIREMIEEVCSYKYRAMALVRGALKDISTVDLRNHADPLDRPKYIFNFIFVAVS
ncbi:FkbM family methyltransferase [Phenylobacterium sp.]|uniref:FkbM family methyltransferase n=1 Tax=Phenylobacterium sp. TaxID=1871053 RepID=UPI002F409405